MSAPTANGVGKALVPWTGDEPLSEEDARRLGEISAACRSIKDTQKTNLDLFNAWRLEDKQTHHDITQHLREVSEKQIDVRTRLAETERTIGRIQAILASLVFVVIAEVIREVMGLRS